MGRRGRSHERARLPFWLHQALEYVVAVVVAGVGLHLGGLTEASLVAAGALLLLSSLATRGPLGAFRLLSPAAHRLVDWAVVVALVAMPLVQLPHFDVLSAALLWLVAGSIAQLARGTRYAAVAARTAPASAPQGRSTSAVVPGGGAAGGSAPGTAAVVAGGMAPSHDDPLADAGVPGVPAAGPAGPGVSGVGAVRVGAPGGSRPASGGLLPSLARLAGRGLGASTHRGRPS